MLVWYARERSCQLAKLFVALDGFFGKILKTTVRAITLEFFSKHDSCEEDM